MSLNQDDTTLEAKNLGWIISGKKYRKFSREFILDSEVIISHKSIRAVVLYNRNLTRKNRKVIDLNKVIGYFKIIVCVKIIMFKIYQQNLDLAGMQSYPEIA